MVALCWYPPPVAVTVMVYRPGGVLPVLMKRLELAEVHVVTEAGLKLSAGPEGVAVAEKVTVVLELHFPQLTQVTVSRYGAALLVLSVTLPDGGDNEKSSAKPVAHSGPRTRAKNTAGRFMASPSRIC